MTTVALNKVGSIDVLDLDIMCARYGRDGLPYPFRLTRPPGFESQDEFAAYAATVPERFASGDLSRYWDCAVAYVEADIRVECLVQYIGDDKPAMRLLACRQGERGFFGAQRPDADVVDVFTLSPYDIGAAMAQAVPLTKPGSHAEIVVPEYATKPTSAFDDGEAFSVRHAVDAQTAVAIPSRDVATYGTVQSHWRPTRYWGYDHSKGGERWVSIRGDGDYIYSPDWSSAAPVTQRSLHRRIDERIAEDIVALREFLNS